MKLHVLHYHAPAAELKVMMQLAGVPDAVVEAVNNVIKLCKACREWQELAPRPAAKLQLASQFNDYLLIDLVFFN